MCSTPRPSGRFIGARKVAVKNTLNRSYAHMMRTASAQYEERQKELNKRHQRLLKMEEHGEMEESGEIK